MCTNKRWIYNKYSCKHVLIGCGVCPACRQAYANKIASRIRNHGYFGYKPLFVHLTYMDKYVPYIKRSELQAIENIDSDDLEECRFSVNVYRKVNRFPWRHYDRIDNCWRTDIEEFPIETIISTESCKNGSDSRFYYKPLKQKEYAKPIKLRGQGDNERIGVIWFPDVQNFIKRLKKKVFDSSLETKFFDVFICSEHGETYQRPHFHLLIWIPEAYLDWYKCAVVDCWPFAVPYRTAFKLEWARNAAKYVSTYLNKHSDFPKFFKSIGLRNRERFSHSKNFGFLPKAFGFEEIISSIQRGTVEYSTFVRKGIKSYAYDFVRIPSYVFGRYFPINFKGFSRFTDYEIYSIIREPSQIAFIVNHDLNRFEYLDEKKLLLQVNAKYSKYGLLCDDSDLYDKEFFKFKSVLQKSYYPIFNYNSDDYLSITKYIDRKFYNFKCMFYPLIKKFAYDFDLVVIDNILREYFAYFTVRLLKLLRQYKWRKHFEKNDSTLDNLDRYDNLYQFSLDSLPSDLRLICIEYDVNPIKLHPNSLATNVAETNQLSYDYYEYQKEHEIVDFKCTNKDGKY